MERTWKKTLAAGIAAVVIVVALVLAGGKLTDHTAPADQTPSSVQQTNDDHQQKDTERLQNATDPNDPSIVGSPPTFTSWKASRRVSASSSSAHSSIQIRSAAVAAKGA